MCTWQKKPKQMCSIMDFFIKKSTNKIRFVQAFNIQKKKIIFHLDNW